MSSRETSDDREKLSDAARYGRLEEVIELSSKFINDEEELSKALIRSCLRGHLDVVKWFVEHTPANINYNREEWLYTPLVAACFHDKLNAVKYLVKTCHADVNLHDKRGEAPLTRACRNVSTAVLMYLLCEVEDLDVNIANINGNTALHLAVWCSKNNYTQLHQASQKGDITDVLRLVYVRGDEINVQDNLGNTPLHWACESGHKDILETLMLAGADETLLNDEGKTPAQVAESNGYSDMLKLLNIGILQQVILNRQKKLKLSLTLWTLRLMKRKRIRSFINSNRCYKLKRTARSAAS